MARKVYPRGIELLPLIAVKVLKLIEEPVLRGTEYTNVFLAVSWYANIKRFLTNAIVPCTASAVLIA